MMDGWVDGWLWFNGILITQVNAPLNHKMLHGSCTKHVCQCWGLYHYVDNFLLWCPKCHDTVLFPIETICRIL